VSAVDRGADVADAVLAALSARDIDSFVECYTVDARIENGEAILADGHEEIRLRYEKLFERFPNLTVRRLGRIAVGSYVVQEEEVVGREPDPQRHIAVYRIQDGLIAHERLLR
jgi:hypothetical protein